YKMEEYRNTYLQALDILNDKLKISIEQCTALVTEAHNQSMKLNRQNGHLRGIHEQNLVLVDVAHMSADAMFPD
ncbi:hypothetical protein FRX31_019150, partial [Thalictrum thalictroides]